MLRAASKSVVHRGGRLVSRRFSSGNQNVPGSADVVIIGEIFSIFIVELVCVHTTCAYMKLCNNTGQLL